MTGLMRKRDSLLSEAQHLSLATVTSLRPVMARGEEVQCHCMQRFMVMIDGFGDL